MNKFLLLTIVGLLSMPSFAQTIFKCHKPFSVFDPSFEQGQELYLDISIKNSAVTVEFSQGFGPELNPFNKSEMDRFFFSEDMTHFVSHWGENYLSMVYLGNLSWGAYVNVGDNDLGLPEEVEMQCRENVDIAEFANGLN